MVDFIKLDKKWQKRWKDAKVFKSKDNSKKKKFYNLEMFPYPSGYGLHVGHSRNFSIGDCISRYKRMRGFNVLYPMGWDSFGLPSENAAIAKGIHPNKSIKQNIKTMTSQMNALGLSYDWGRELSTHNPKYYKWDQWLFLKLLENGLAYRKKAAGNWCPSCKTTLANEDVKNGLCWRCDSEVIQKEIDQWFVKITAYADKLLSGLNNIDWSERLKTMQRNWIGKSEGLEIKFKLEGSSETINVFTTRPDTLFGCSFVVLAPEHPKVKKLVKGTKYEKDVDKFLERTKKLSELDRIAKEKAGLFLGKHAINPINGEKVPIFIANFVLLGYGTGAIMAVPAHDQRDFEFAEKYKLPIKIVIDPDKYTQSKGTEKAYGGEGVLVNSGQFTGQNSKEAVKAISSYLISNRTAKRTVNYKIRDWNISRQRYWGAPIPIINCDACGAVPVPEKDLPVELPLKVDFGKEGAPPLATNKKFIDVKCPTCKGPAKRETDTMTTFVDSAWYFLRFCDPKNNKEIFDKNKVNYWMPVDQYTGGIEHAVGHLLYSRFIVKFLKKIGYVKFDEPFTKLLNQGMVNMGGSKMSKSKGNVVDPLPVVKKYGADTLRTYILFVAQPDTSFEWFDKDIRSINKLLQRTLKLSSAKEDKDKKAYIESITQNKITQVTHHIENLQFNRALIEIFDLQSKIERYPSIYSIKTLLKLLSPFAPHTCEEVWEKLGEKKMLCQSAWPELDKKKVSRKAEQEIGALDKTTSDIKHILQITKKKAKKIYIYVIPPELANYKSAESTLKKEFKVEVTVFASNDPNKTDPEGKAKKARPGKPGIYIE